MKRYFLSFFLLLALYNLKAQQGVAIGATDPKPNAILYLQGNGQQGLIVPIVNNRNNILTPGPEAGMIVFDDTAKKLYYYNGSDWVEVGGGGGTGGAGGLVINGNEISLSGSSPDINLAEVAPASGQAGQILMWTGTAWSSSAVTLPEAGHVLKWNGTSWIAQADDTGVGTVPTLFNGQILVGDGNNNVQLALTGDATLNSATLTISPNAVNSGKIEDGTITSADIEDATITGDDIANASIAAGKLAASSASEGQVLKFVGGVWVPSFDDVGSNGTLPTLAQNQFVTNNGTSNVGVSITGDISFNASQANNTVINNDAVTSQKIADGTITGADLDGAIDINTSGTLNVTGSSTSLTSTTLSLKGATWPGSNAAGVLTNDGAGVLTWSTAASGGTDVTGQTGALIGNGSTISARTGSGGQFFRRNPGNTDYEFTNIDNGTGIAVTSSATGISIATSGNFGSQNLATTGTLSSGAITTPDIDINSLNYTWPNAHGAGNRVLTNNGSGTLTWAPAGSTDLTGQTGTLVGNGTAITGRTASAGGQFYRRNSGNTDFEFASFAAGTGIAITPGAGNLTIATSGNFGTQNLTTTGTLSSGAITAPGINLNTLTYTWPNAHGAGTRVLTNNGAGALTWGTALSTTLNSSQILVGNASNVATPVAMSGDVAISNTGLTTIQNNAIGTAEISDATIADADVSATAAIAGTKVNPNFGGQLVTGTGGDYTGELMGARFSVSGANQTYGLYAESNSTADQTYGLYGRAGGSGPTSVAVTGLALGDATLNVGVFGSAQANGTRSVGVYGEAAGSTENWAGWFAGNTLIQGPLSVGSTIPNFGTAGYVLTSQGPSAAPEWVAPVAAVSPANFLIRGNNAGNAQIASTIYNPAGGYVGFGRTTPISATSVFDVEVDVGSGLGGMWINSNDPNGAPYYGYAVEGLDKAYTYYDNNNGNWMVNNSGDRFTVTADGEVGIGTINPLSRLDVNGSAVIGGGYAGTTTGPFNGLAVQGSVSIGTNASTNMADIEGSLAVGAAYSGNSAAPSNGAIIEGDVGIGTNNVDGRLHVAENVADNTGVDGAFINIQNSNAGAGTGFMAGIRFRTDGVSAGANARYKSGIFHQKTGTFGVGDLMFAVSNAASSSSVSAADSKMIIKSTGEVGIGTNSPGQALEVSSGASTAIRIRTPINTGGHLEFIESGTTWGTNALGFRLTYDGLTDNFSIISGVNAALTNHLVIDRGAQRVGIGRNPTTANFEVEGNSYFTGNIGILTTTPTHDVTIKQSSNSNTSDNGLAVYSATSNNYWKFHTSGTLLRFSYHDGTTLNTNLFYGSGDAAWTFTSDRRLKTEIEPMETVLDKVLKLEPVRFYYTNNRRANGKVYGLIAQDVEPIFPDIVRKPSEENEHYGLTYEYLNTIAIKAIQEQQQIIEQQRSEIEALKQALASMEAASNGKEDELKNLAAEITKIKQALGMDAKAETSDK